ncbi:bifunctional diguanylate cyclase/phosphodiesterase [Segnochrobactraceae bacterium EtOH-i3]
MSDQPHASADRDTASPPLLNIGRKFLAYLLILSVLPLGLLGFVSYQTARTIVTDQITRFSHELLSLQVDYLGLETAQIEALLTNIAGVQAIVNTLTNEPSAGDDYSRLVTQARIGYILNSFLTMRGVVAIDIFTAAGNHYHVGDTLAVSGPDPERRRILFAEAVQAGNRPQWLGVIDSLNNAVSGGKVVAVAKRLWKLNRATLAEETVALIIVSYATEELYDHFSKAYIGDGGSLMVVDAKGNLVFSPNREEIGTPAPVSIRTGLDAGLDRFSARVGTVPVLVNAIRAPDTEWTVLTAVPIATLDAPANTIALTVTAALAVCLLLVAGAGYAYSRGVVVPIRHITERFKAFQAGGDGPMRPLPVVGRDEIAELTRWFNTFLETAKRQRDSETALRESEERYALAIRAANDALWDWNLLTHDIYLSPRWKTMVGREDEGIGRSPREWIDRVHPHDRAAVIAAIRTHLDGHTPYLESEHRLQTADGTYIWTLARGLAVRGADDRPTRMAGSHSDITARKRAEEQLRHDASHDVLTGLINRRTLYGQLSRALADGERRRTRTGLLMLDLDHFKDINDTLGHDRGDAILVAAGQMLTRVVRHQDQVARLGGDEFAILCQDLEQGVQLADVGARLVAAFQHPIDVGEDRFAISVSVGISVGEPGDTADDLMREADLALYEAKREGRNRYAFFDATLEEAARERLQVETALRSRPMATALQLVFQPQVTTRSRIIDRFEALARWEQADGTLLTPDIFIPAAERCGLIHDLTRAVISKALDSLAILDSASDRRMPGIAVNLSAIDLEHADFAQETVAELNRRGVDPARIEFEITESILLRSTPAVLENIRRLGAAGCRFALDDFGTGFSSMAYLSQFPIQTIKIDKSFVRGLGQSPEKEELTRAIIDLGHGMSKIVVAEGVETEEQAAYLAAHGCDLLQGYLFSRPVPIRQALDLVDRVFPTPVD